MGVSYKVADWLNTFDHDAVYLSQQGLHTMEDHLIIEKAANENRIILTADMDFGQIVAFSKISQVSIIQFRLFDLSPANVIPKLNIIFDKFSGHLINGPLIIT